MIVQSSSSKIVNKKSRWLIFAIYMLVLLVSETFYRQPLYDISLDFILNLQGPDPDNNSLMKIGEFISIFGNSGAYAPIILLVYNFANIYKTYVLIMSLLLSSMFISIFKMIYESPRPFWSNMSIKPFGCEGGWGNPSGHSLSSCVFYLTLWNIIFGSSFFRENKYLKRISLLFVFLFIFSIMFSRNLVGAHSINQTLFGFSLGLGIYFFLFYVICIKVNNYKQMAYMLQFKNINFILIHILVTALVFMVFFFYQQDVYFDQQNQSMDYNRCSGIPINKRLQREALMTFSLFLTNIAAFIGMKFEYYFTFRENIQNWTQFNFEIDEKGDDESILTKISINKQTQWNHTNSFYSILRLIVISILCIIPGLIYNYIRWEEDIFIIFFFKIILTVGSIFFGFFYLFKIILTKLRMINFTLYSILQDGL